MPTPDKAGRHHYQKFLQYNAVSLLVLICLYMAGGIGVPYWFESVKHHHGEVAASRITHRNEFWHMVNGDKPPDNTDWGQLAAALKPFVDTSVIEKAPKSKLLPSDLAHISVPDEEFGRVPIDIDLPVFGTYNHGKHHLGGQFSPDFLADFAVIQQHRVSDLITPVPAFATSLTFTPGGIPFDLWIPFVAACLTLMAFALAWVVYKDGFSESLSFIFDGVATPEKLTIMILNPVIFIPWAAVRIHYVLGRSPFTLADWMGQRARSREEEKKWQSRLAANQVSEHWVRAKADLNRLMSVPGWEKDKDISSAVKDTRALVDQLERFPDILSVEAARLVAKQTLRHNADSRDAVRARLEAEREVGEL